MMKWTYLLINILTILFPLLVSFEPRVKYARQWRYVFPAIIFTAVGFLIWDVIFTYCGVWGFNAKYISGGHLWGLPVEEILFFFCVPFSCIFIYEVVRWFSRTDQAVRWSPWIMKGLVVGCALLVVGGWPRTYTVTVSGLLGMFLLWHLWRVQGDYVGHFHRAFVFTLVPFLLVNGLLTRGWGGSDPTPVVWYNDAHNLGLRVGTIPVEDFLYCYLLLFSNVTFLEYFRQRSS